MTISFAGYDALMRDVAFIGKLGNRPDLPGLLQAPLNQMTGGKGLAGLDKKRPWASFIRVEMPGFTPEVHSQTCVPVTDLKQFLANFDAFVETSSAGDGIFEVKPKMGGTNVFVKEAKGGWAVLSNNKEDLSGTPADPIKALGGLNERYAVAAKLSIQNLPQQIRNTILQFLQAAAQMQGGDQAEVVKRSIEQVTMALNELDAVVIGLDIDEKAATAALDISVTAKPGTKMAAQMAEAAEKKTDFAGFLAPGTR